MLQSSLQLDPETKRQIADLAEWWGLSTTRNTTAVIRRLVTEAHAREAARRELSAHDAAMASTGHSVKQEEGQ